MQSFSPRQKGIKARKVTEAEQEGTASSWTIREGVEEVALEWGGTLCSIRNSKTQGHMKGSEGQLKVAASLPLLHPSPALPQAVYNSSIREGKINIYQHKLKTRERHGQGVHRVCEQTGSVGVQVAGSQGAQSTENGVSGLPGPEGPLGLCHVWSSMNRRSPLLQRHPQGARRPPHRGAQPWRCLGA